MRTRHRSYGLFNDKGMKIFFAGADDAENYRNILLEAGATCKLESYWSLKTKKSLSAPSAFEHYLLDSGGFVARNKGIEINVKNYARFIDNNNITLAFNLDTNVDSVTLGNQTFLEDNTKAYILPIYHGSDYFGGDRDLLTYYLDQGYPYIALGGIAGVPNINWEKQLEFYSYVFRHTEDKIAVHGLGITSKRILEMYPWYSVDSTSWLAMARYGRGSAFGIDERVSTYYAKKVHYLVTTSIETEWWINLEQYLTKLWQKRGITWDHLDLSQLKESTTTHSESTINENEKGTTLDKASPDTGSLNQFTLFG